MRFNRCAARHFFNRSLRSLAASGGIKQKSSPEGDTLHASTHPRINASTHPATPELLIAHC
jgi:hypothetical protein